MNHARRQWVRWAVGAGAVVSGMAAMALFAATWEPSWYQPAKVAPEECAAIRNELPNFGNEIGTHLQAGQRFRIILPDYNVNRWLAARSEIWPGLRDALPEYLVDPVISFQPGRIVLGVRYRGSGLASVLSLAVNLQMEEHGGAIGVRVDGLRAGYLPVPRMLVDGPARKALDREAGKHLNALLRRLWSQTAEYMPIDAVAQEPTVAEVPLAAMLGDIWEFRLPTRSRWPNGGFSYSIADLRIEQGKLLIDVVPAARQATRPVATTRSGV